MYEVYYTHKFEKSLKLCKKRGLDISLFEEVSDILVKSGKLPAKYKPHKLSGDYSGFWECHIQANWLMVWLQDDQKLILTYIATGTHSDIFG